LAPRVQIGATVPRTVGSTDGTGPVGGVGTSYVSVKIGLLTKGSVVKLAVSPTVQILGEGAVQALPADQGRATFGLPVSAEVSARVVRVFGSTGFFSSGVWFAGGGVVFQPTSRVGSSMSFTRAWASDDATGITRDRRELSGAVSYSVTSRAAVFGSLSHTIATTDGSGAGATIGGGLTFLIQPSVVN
jgi:hypothetical protein